MIVAPQPVAAADAAPAHPRIDPLALFQSGWTWRRLIARLTKREILARFRGSVLGLSWLVLLPLLMLAVYTFAFAVVFKARWAGAETSTGTFALVLFAGLTIFSLFSETINRAPTLILENPSYVKKVIFPIEILPWITLSVSAFNFAVSFLVFAIFYPFVFGAPPWTVVLLPLTLVPLVLVTLGLSWFLASVGVFLRDIRPFVGVLTTAMMFLSPIFYPVEAVPEGARWLLALNPLTPTLEQARGVLFWGTVPSFAALAVQFAVGWVFAWLGYAWFARTRKAFADVL